MRWMPRNVPLAVVLRLLLLTTAAVVILAIGMYRYDWQIGEKKAPPVPQYQKNSVKLLTEDSQTAADSEAAMEAAKEEQELAEQLTGAILGQGEQEAIEKIKVRQQYQPAVLATPAPAGSSQQADGASTAPASPKKGEQEKALTEEEELEKLLEEAVTP